MTINELERLTGITKQNIRFYEKKELLHPARNSENNYREYTEEDLAALKMIKLLRKLDFSLEDIRKTVSKEASLHTLLSQHLTELETKQTQLNACINICKELLNEEIETLDVDKTLDRMDTIEKKGGQFMSIIKDYKKFAAAERRKHFSFKPDTMVLNTAEFTEALFQYANENDLNLVITKEGMSPTFTIDGQEYTAYRAFDRFGATVHCTLTQSENDDIPEKRKKIFRLIHGPYLFLILLFIVMALSRHSSAAAALVAIMIFPYIGWMFGWMRPRMK